MLGSYLLAVWLAQAPLSLEQAVHTAVSLNEASMLAAVETQRADAARLQALGSLLPRVTVGGTLRQAIGGGMPLQPLGAIAPLMGTYADAQLDQPVVNLPVAWELGAAGTRAGAAALEQAAARRAVALQAAILYLKADAWAAKAAAEGDRAQRAADHLQLAQQRAAAALAAAHEVWVAEQELAEALQAQAEFTQAWQLALADLAQSLGTELQPEETEFPEALWAQACAPAAPEDALQALAKAQRPDLQALHGLAQAGAQGERAAQLRFLPTLHANTQAFVPLGGDLSWYVGASLRWQVFDGEALLAQPALRAADHRAAVVRLEAGQRAVRNRVQGARAALTAVCSAQTQAMRREAAANKRAAYARDRYAAGLEEVSAVKLATDEWARASVGLAQLRRDVLVAAMGLRNAVGGALFAGEEMP